MHISIYMSVCMCLWVCSFSQINSHGYQRVTITEIILKGEMFCHEWHWIHMSGLGKCMLLISAIWERESEESHIWGLRWLQNEFKISPGHLSLPNRIFNKKNKILNFNRIKNESVQDGSPLRGVSGAEAELLPGTYKVLINSPEPIKHASMIMNESVLGITG